MASGMMLVFKGLLFCTGKNVDVLPLSNRQVRALQWLTTVGAQGVRLAGGSLGRFRIVFYVLSHERLAAFRRRHNGRSVASLKTRHLGWGWFEVGRVGLRCSGDARERIVASRTQLHLHSTGTSRVLLI